MKINKPKKQLYTDATIYYVESGKPGDEIKHIVVKTKQGYFCDCRDFMIRRLPLLGTPGFSLCKHAKFVSERSTKFGVFVMSCGGFIFRSDSIPQAFNSRKTAQLAVDSAKDAKYVDRYVEEL